MEILSVVNHQFVFLVPVGLVLICAGLVFAFGFKSSVEPPSFRQLSLASDDRKQGIKKKKIKEKKLQSNGHATVLIEDSEGKKTEVTTKSKQSNKTETLKAKDGGEKIKKQDNQKSPAKTEKKSERKVNKENVDSKKKKEVKPEDFDDGKWETAVSRKDKKNRKKDDDILSSLTPEKTPKKKIDSPVKKNKIEEKPVAEVKPSAADISEMKPSATEISDIKPSRTEISEVKKEMVVEENKVETTPVVVSSAKIEEQTATVEIAAEKVEEEEQVSKKKKVKKVKGSGDEVTEKDDKKIDVKSEETISDDKTSSVNVQDSKISEAVFDELGDVWKEAPQKKSKKKVRKE